MSIERQRRVLDVLDEVIEAPSAQRAARLKELCGADVELREEVRRLLELEEPGGLLGEPVLDLRSASDPGIGRRIGDYELIELLGRGGMGTVYLARREAFEQRVAVKIIRRGLELDPVLIRRFENERAILARLEHPSIARLLDGGTAGDGLPYVVMEYVEGEPIDAYCRRLELGLRQRLELFCQVLDAVQYAHRNLVVHRDLKPGNLLVDAAGHVKLLDFGIAKLLDESLAASVLQTATGEAPMTPRYASPEQIRRQPISTASDVYVLGVLLFELLTGLDAYGAETSDPGLLSRAVLELEPERPSTAVRRRAEDPSAPAARRLRSRLAGDLDAVVLKAMRKEPAERYGSVEQLADDIRRHLGGEPVRARRSTFAYRAGKFVRRHRVGLAALALFMAILTAAAAISTYFFVQAQDSARRTERLGLFVRELIKTAGSQRDAGALVTLLDREEASYVQGELDAGELADRAEMAQRFGLAWRAAGDLPRAREAMAASYRWARRAYAPEHREVAKSLNNLFAVLVELGEFELAATLFRDRIAELELQAAPRGLIFRSKSNLATALKFQGELDEAERLHREVRSAREDAYLARFGPHDQDVATSRHNVAAVLYARGCLEEALDLASVALATRERTIDPRKQARIPTTRKLTGQILVALDRPRVALEHLEKSLAERTEQFGRFDFRTAEVQRLLAEALLDHGPSRAESLLTEAIATFDRRLEDSWRQADAQSVLALLHARQGRLDDPSIAERAHERLAEVRGAGSTVTLRAKARWREVLELAATRGVQGDAGAP